MAKLKELKCKQCGGVMATKNVAKHSQGGALFFIFAGLILCFTAVGLIVGVPMLIIGLVMGCTTKKCWVCKDCGVKIDRT